MALTREELERLANGPMVRGPKPVDKLATVIERQVARKGTPPKGHAGAPGTGPADKVCGQCVGYVSVEGGARTHPKCEKNREAWTRGPGSDIRRSDPACQLFELKPVETKADYVRREAAKPAGGHHCHWPGCERAVPPAMWGCYPHWRILKEERPDLARAIWRAFRPGQEVSKTPSRDYVEAARAVQQWITLRSLST